MRTLALLLALALPASAAAQTTEGDLVAALESEARERAAAERIAAGMLTGRISSAENTRLERLLERLRAYQLRVYADGVVSRRERARLDRMHARFEDAITHALER